MPRSLVPMTVYLTEASKAEAERRAAKKSIAPATLLRMILIGDEKPLGRPPVDGVSSGS